MQLILISPPNDEPVYLDEMKDHLKMSDITEDDALIFGYIQSATQEAQHELGRKLITQSWDMRLDRFPVCGALTLPFPVQSVVVSYYDAAGDLQTWADTEYWLDEGVLVQRITPKDAWPVTQCRPQAVKITMVAGYGDVAEAVPQNIRDWIKLRVTDLHSNRGTVNVGAAISEFRYVSGLLDPHRVPLVG